jgi:hypothetical protein
MKEVVHGLVRTEFEQQVDVGSIFEEVLKSHNVRVTQTHLNGDFLLQLFLPILRLQCFLRYYLAGEYFFVFANAGELDTGSKRSFSKLFALDVLNNSAICSVFFDYGARCGLDLNLNVFLDCWQGKF